jgi:RHS repeat-associated protein
MHLATIAVRSRADRVHGASHERRSHRVVPTPRFGHRGIERPTALVLAIALLTPVAAIVTSTPAQAGQLTTPDANGYYAHCNVGSYNASGNAIIPWACQYTLGTNGAAATNVLTNDNSGVALDLGTWTHTCGGCTSYSGTQFGTGWIGSNSAGHAVRQTSILSKSDNTFTASSFSACGIVFSARGTNGIPLTPTRLPCHIDSVMLNTVTPPLPADYYSGSSPGPAVLPAKAARGGGSRSMPHGSECECHTSKPVDTATGNFWHTFQDFAVPGRGPILDLSHTYNSGNAASDGPLGHGWTHSYNVSLTIGSGEVDLNEETGSQIAFTASGPSYTAPLGVVGSLVHNTDGTYTFTRLGRGIFTFDSTGRLTAEKDLNGYTTTLTYPTGQMVVTDPAGRTLTFIYTGTHVTQVADSASPTHTVTFAYNDGAGDLTDVTDQAGKASHFTYNTTSHLLLTMRRPSQAGVQNPTVLTNAYDSQGRVTTQTDELNRTTGFDYTTVPGSTIVTDPRGKKSLQTYAYGVLTSRTDGYGTGQAATWTFQRDPSTLGLTSVTDPNSHTTTMTYDANGNLTGTTDALNHSTSAIYNTSFNKPTSLTDANGVTATMTYDAAGNLLTTSRPLLNGSGQTIATQTTTDHYDDVSHPGDVTSVTDPLSKTTVNTYDATTGLLTAVQAPPTPENAAGDTTTYGYDAPTGLRTSMVSAKGNVTGGNPAAYTTTYAYDAVGRPTVTKDPLWSSANPTAHESVRTYDDDGNLSQSTDGTNHTTTYHYDAAGQLTSETRPDTSVLSYGYDSDGNRNSYTDGTNHTTSYHFDDAALHSALTSEVDPDSRTTTYTYDGAGNVLTKQDQGGNCAGTPQTGCTTSGYDATNRLTSITYSDGTTPNVSSVTYDNDGHRTAMTDGTGTSHWAWDSLGRMTSSTDGSGATVDYSYDLRNDQTSIAYPGTGTVTQGYDDAGRLASVTDWLSPANTSTFGYDANSNLTAETLPNGVTNSYGFDAADQLTSINDTTGATSVFAATYSRDGAGLLSGDSSAPPTTADYQYTPLNQLCYAGSSSSSACSAPPVGATPYGYDAADNLTTNGATAQSFDAASQLCWTLAGSSSNGCASPPTGATTFGYDTRGNRTSTVPTVGLSTCDAYDEANRLTSITSGVGGACTAPTAVGSYTYNGTGLRQSKTVGGTTTQFRWDQSGTLPLLLQEAAGTNVTSYLYGPAGLPLEQITLAGTAYWYHHDQLGSTRAMTDATGILQATYNYDPYGNITTTTGTLTNPLRFAGEYTDAESGLIYMRARYYDPATAQFIGRDPIEKVTRRPYGYADGNPLNLLDPTGLEAQQSGHYQVPPRPPGMSDYDYQGYVRLMMDEQMWACEAAQRAKAAAAQKAKEDAFEARLAAQHQAEEDAIAAEQNDPDIVSDMFTHPQFSPTPVVKCIQGAVGGAVSSAITGSDPRIGAVVGCTVEVSVYTAQSVDSGHAR